MAYHTIHWTAEKISRRLRLIEPRAYRWQAGLGTLYFRALESAAVLPPITGALDPSTWTPLEPPVYWGKQYQNFVLRGSFTIPPDWPAEAPVALVLPLGTEGDFAHPEALLYVDGESYATLDRYHTEVRLKDSWRDGQAHALALHGYIGGQARDGMQPFMLPGAVVAIDRPTRQLVTGVRVALGTAERLPEDSPVRQALLNALQAAFQELDTREPLGDDFYASVPLALSALNTQVYEAGEPLPARITAAGHAHIDVAWLWELTQTRLKARRTFHTALRLMEEFPAYHFAQSQPQLYEFVRQDDPALFAAIQERVADGQWEPVGGMWVEADCNLTGPESLARQLLLGRTFFRQHFGAEAESPVLWLPDVFGYAWNLPQLVKEAGMRYFFTTKISWNQYNRFPYESFWWQGLDGTRVLTHFSTTPPDHIDAGITYNAYLTPNQVLGSWKNFSQKEQVRAELLMVYGHGDGGGGPTREMLENAQALANYPGQPHLQLGRVGDFYQRLEEQGAHLPVWNGELYFELHRGTYTTQSRNKRANRKAEFQLHDAEFLASLAALTAGYDYPQTVLHQAWQTLCLNQFHDVIPGSSVGQVYSESLAQYAEVSQAAETVCAAALEALAGPGQAEVLLVNPTAFTRHDLARLPLRLEPGQALVTPANEPVLAQPASDGGTLIAPGVLPPYSVLALKTGPGPASGSDGVSELQVTPGLLENRFLRVELDEAGDITRIYDKLHRREVLPPGAKANQFQIFEDRPLEWDAWDIDVFYEDRQWLAEPAEAIRVVEAGPLRAMLEIERRIMHSRYKQRISLAWDSPRLDFDTWIDWRERHMLLKTAFPVEVLSPQATYEIQWGSVQRPTHRNTSWDLARFEVCAQKWADLSEGDYGVSLLNDCKYGHDIQGNVLRLSLLRAPTWPDPEADQGEHQFQYSLLPHAGQPGEQTIAAAYCLNDPLRVWVRPQTAPGVQAKARRIHGSFLQVDAANLIIETIKRAEDGNGWIVRLYDSQRSRGTARLTCALPVRAAWRTNLLEEPLHALQVEGHSVHLSYRPFEIITLRLDIAA